MELENGFLVRLKEGDVKTFEALFWKYNRHVYHFACSLLYDAAAAEDITQQVFLKIWERRAAIDPEQNFQAYLFTIARHLVYKETQHRVLSESLTHTLKKHFPAVDTSTEEKTDTRFLEAYIDALIDELPPARREIFRLSRFEHLSHQAIAKKLSLSEKTVETQIGRALRFLRDRLSDEQSVILALFFLSGKC